MEKRGVRSKYTGTIPKKRSASTSAVDRKAEKKKSESLTQTKEKQPIAAPVNELIQPNVINLEGATGGTQMDMNSPIEIQFENTNTQQHEPNRATSIEGNFACEDVRLRDPNFVRMLEQNKQNDGASAFQMQGLTNQVNLMQQRENNSPMNISHSDDQRDTLSNFNKFYGLQAISETTALLPEAIQSQLELLEMYYVKLIERGNVLECSPYNSPAENSEISEILLEAEELYLRLKTNLRVQLNTANRQAQTAPATTSNVHQSNISSAIELKQMRFGGDYRKWQKFKSLFEEFFHNNTQMPESEKFYRLDALIVSDSEAYNTISGLP